MPPMIRRMYTFAEATKFEELGEDELFLQEREPFGYVALADNEAHVVREGESVFSLAGYYFRRFRRPAGLWWIICDFQPQPIHDPTIALLPGQVLIIPSPRTVEELVFSEDRRTRSLT